MSVHVRLYDKYSGRSNGTPRCGRRLCGVYFFRTEIIYRDEARRKTAGAPGETMIIGFEHVAGGIRLCAAVRS